MAESQIPIPEAPFPSVSFAQRWIGRVPRNGVLVVVATALTLNAIRVLSTIVLTRLLDSSAFGVVGIIASVTTIFAMVSDIGLHSFVIRHASGIDPKLLDEVWTIRLMRSTCLAVAAFALSGPIAAYVGKPIQPAIAVASLIFLLDGASSLSFATAIRNRQVLRVSVTDVASTVVQVSYSIVAALILHSYWALVSAILVGNLAKAVLSYALFPGSRRRLSFSRARAAEVWQFSRFITASSILTVLLGQTDKVVLSRLFPLSLFGLYSIAANLALAPIAFTYPYATRVLFPIYAKTHRETPQDFRRVYYATKRLPSLLFTFAVGGLVGGAPILIAILYQPRYMPAAQYVSLLSIGSMLALGNVVANEALIAVGRMWTTTAINIVRITWLAIAAPTLYHFFGTLGVVIAVAGIEAPALIGSWVFQARAGFFDWQEEALMLGGGGAGILIGAGLVHLAAPWL